MKKQLIRTCVMAAAVVGLLAACTTLRVTTDVNPTLISSARCHTYAWAGAFRGDSTLRTTIANPLNESRLRAAIASSLQSRGIQPATQDAECLVGYGIGASNSISGMYPGWGYGYGYGWGWRHGYGYGGGWGWDDPYVYQQGIVAVDLYDAKSHQPMWHASVEQSLFGLTGADAEKKIDAAVAAIFTKFPG